MSRSEEVRNFYERMPYPAPRTSLDAHRYRNPDRRRAEFHLMWPAKQPREKSPPHANELPATRSPVLQPRSYTALPR